MTNAIIDSRSAVARLAGTRGGRRIDPFPNVGTDLVRIHRAITRALAVSLQHSQAGGQAEPQRQGFSAYARALAVLLHAHHAGEDEIAFPFWQARFPVGAFDELMEQHRRMIPFIDQVQGWAEQGADTWQVGALNGLHHSLAGLQALWQAHIALEEATVGPENARTYLSPEDNALLGKQLAEHGQAHSQPAELVMPFIVYNLAEKDREDFLRIFPPILASQLIPIAWKPVWQPMSPFLLVD